jgi:hypothetical protein
MMNKQLILTTAVAAFMLSAVSLAATNAFAGHGGGPSPLVTCQSERPSIYFEIALKTDAECIALNSRVVPKH